MTTKITEKTQTTAVSRLMADREQREQVLVMLRRLELDAYRGR